MCCILPSLLWYRRMKTVTAIVSHQTRGAFNLFKLYLAYFDYSFGGIRLYIFWVCCLSQKKTFNYQFIDKKEKHWSRKDSFLMFLRSNTVIFLSYPNWFLLQDLSISLSNFCCSIIHSMNKGNAVPVSSSFTATYPFDKQKLLPFINSKKKKKVWMQHLCFVYYVSVMSLINLLLLIIITSMYLTLTLE